jgi:hypothetical protein
LLRVSCGVGDPLPRGGLGAALLPVRLNLRFSYMAPLPRFGHFSC